MGIYLQPQVSTASKKLVDPSPHSQPLASYKNPALNQLRLKFCGFWPSGGTHRMVATKTSATLIYAHELNPLHSQFPRSQLRTGPLDTAMERMSPLYRLLGENVSRPYVQ